MYINVNNKYIQISLKNKKIKNKIKNSLPPYFFYEFCTFYSILRKSNENYQIMKYYS